MEDFQQRVIEEKVELDAKLDSLKSFLQTDTFANLQGAEQERLFRQATIMKDYSAVLQERISAF